MSCARREDVDIAAFVAEPRAAEWAEFRAHYPGCRECSREMLRWSTLEGVLRNVAEPTHPAEELLLAYRRAPQSLSEAQRVDVTAHLDACGPCRDALGAVVSLDLKGLLAAAKPAAAPEPARTGRLENLLESVRGLFALPRPALAAAALAVLLLALGLPYLWQRAGAPAGETPPIARRDEVSEPPVEAPQPPPDAIAHEGVTPPAPEAPASPPEPPPVQVADEAPPRPREPEAPPAQVAERAPAPAPAVVPEPAPAAPARKPAPPREETWIVASLGPEPLLYAAAGDLPAGRIGGSVRAGAAIGSGAVALVPDRVALTLEAAPTLYWYLPAASEEPLEVRVNDLDAMHTVLATTLRPPHAAGVHALRLGDHSAELASGRNYEWIVSLPGGDDEGSGGILRRIEPGEGLRASLARADAAERVRLLAGNGLWYDALDLLSRSIEKRPDDVELRRARASLLDQGGLAAPAAWDRSR